MKRIVSGISPSGDGALHIGNYLGAVKQFIEISKENDCFLFIADLHALTTIQDKARLQVNTENLILNELALLSSLGSMDHITFYRQSDIGFHPELQTIISNVTPLGLLKRAHAYKDKLEKEMTEDDINVGLFNYPILMAADILLYKPDLVPVGKDQKQHIEITRDIAERFNKIYGGDKGDRGDMGEKGNKGIFTLPEAYIPETVATILGTDGKRKMSKSLGNIISIFEEEEVIKKQVMGCYTDPTRAHADDPGHVEGNMVFTYLRFFSSSAKATADKGMNKVDELKDLYRKGKISDVEVKNYLFESLMSYFAPARARYQELKANPKLVKEILEKGTARARVVASETMKEVREAVGLINQYSFHFVILNEVKNPIGKTNIQGDPSSANRRTQDDTHITIDDFSKVELRVGKVTGAENVEKSEKLIRLHVDFGEDPSTSLRMTRVIFTGVRGYGYTPEDFSGKQFFFVTNLQYRKMLGEESQGMILAVDGADGKPQFVPAEGMPLGAKIR